MSVIEELEAEPWAFDFHMALRRLDGAYPDRPSTGTARSPGEEPVRFGQDPSLGFAPAAIQAFQAPHNGETGRMRLAFLGLFGTQGPLPLHFTEHARDGLRGAGDRTFAAFVDLFQHRLFAFFHRAWALSQPAVGQDRSETNPFLRYLGALCGVGLPSMHARDGIPQRAKVQFVSRLSGNLRNAEGLEAILQEYFGVPVRLEEFIGEWLDIPPEYRWQLGRAREVSALGETTVAGARSFQRAQKFRVTLGPLGAADFQSFLPGTERLQALAALVRMYVGDELAWDVRLRHDSKQRQQLCLGHGSRIAYSSWLGASYRAGVGIEDLLVPAPARGRTNPKG
ncbi:MAG: type VI secretion system baseplate subunit TssG [Deltaproteobacteria bacterium]